MRLGCRTAAQTHYLRVVSGTIKHADTICFQHMTVRRSLELGCKSEMWTTAKAQTLCGGYVLPECIQVRPSRSTTWTKDSRAHPNGSGLMRNAKEG